MYPIQHRKCMDGIDNLLVLLIGGIPIALPIVLSVTMAIGSHRLSQQGAITKRITVIEEMTGMNVLCSYKIGTLNKLIDGEEAEERRERAGRLHGSSESSTVLVLWFSEKGGGFSLSSEEGICDIWWLLRSPSRVAFDLLWIFFFFGRLHRLHKGFSDLWRIFGKFYGAGLRL
ncbi:hypothetical protein V6N11_044334 [Hibiscus sabdariffa]|uniref:Uncharacterized protein n=1 Tax=Hibiscus sabdariffa TaxID=183260 RepID=A0ABR2REW1_9ROSI